MPALIFAALWLLAILASSRLSCLALPQQPRFVVVLGAGALLPVLVQFQVLLAGCAGHLTAPVILAMSAAIAFPLLLLTPRSARPRGAAHTDAELSHPLWAIGLAGALGGAVLFRAIWLRQTYMVDDFSYHALAPAMWVQAKSLVYAPPNYHAYYPFSPHTFAAWLILPFGHDGLVCLSGLYWLALAAGAAYVIARQTGAQPGVSILAALGVPLATEAMRNALTFVGVDVAGLAYILAAVAMLGATIGETRARGALLFAGIFAGYAVGAKISFAPLALALLVVVLVRHDRWVSAPVFACAAAITGGFWYVRNLWWTGNPVYPSAFGPFRGGMPDELLGRTKLITWLTHPPDGVSHFGTLGWEHLNWPYALGVAALAGLLAAPIALTLLRRQGHSAAMVGRILLLLALVALAAYPFMPFSGTVNGATQPLRTDLRFILTPYVCAWLLVAAAGALGGWWRHASMALLALGVFVGAGKTFIELGAEVNSGELAAMAGGGIAMLLWTLMRLPRARLLASPILLSVLAAAALFRVGSFAEVRRDNNGAYLSYYGGSAQPIGKAWKVIGELKTPQRVTVFGPGGYMAYPLLGRNLQHTLVPVEESGAPRAPMHRPAALKTPASNLTDNLLAQRVTVVLVTKWNGRAWPSQHAILESDPRAKKRYDDGYSAVYELAPAAR